MKKTLFTCVLGLLLASCAPGKTDYPQFTACLTESKTVMFGASWCPHCASQKKLFGKSVKQVPYFECSKDGVQVEECDKRDILSYPTWQFPDTVIQKLPEKEMKSLFDYEFAKVEHTLESVKTSKAPVENIDSIIATYVAKISSLKTSKVSDYEKLKTLTFLTIEGDEKDPTKAKFVEKPVYMTGRMSGERTLQDIALYSGCVSAYEADLSFKK